MIAAAAVINTSLPTAVILLIAVYSVAIAAFKNPLSFIPSNDRADIVVSCIVNSSPSTITFLLIAMFVGVASCSTL
jgi:hypothetical protein